MNHIRYIYYGVLYVVLNILFYGMCAAKRVVNDDLEYQKKVFDALSARLKAFRIAKGYKNYEAFAFKFDFSRAQISRYEKGEDLRISTLLRLLKALEVNPDEFFADIKF